MMYEYKTMLIIPLRDTVAERPSQLGGTSAFYSGDTSSSLVSHNG